MSEEEKRQVAAMQWQPPKIPHGDIVLFYKEGVKTALPPVPMVAYTQSRSGRTINLRPLAGGEAMMNVRFLHDPRNEMLDEAELRRTGSWDFTEHHYLLEKVRGFFEGDPVPAAGSGDSELTPRIEALEKSNAELLKSNAALLKSVESLGTQITKLLTEGAGKK